VRARTSEIADALPATAEAQREHSGTVKGRTWPVITVRHPGATVPGSGIVVAARAAEDLARDAYHARIAVLGDRPDNPQ
jgi:hypothetical protein